MCIRDSKQYTARLKTYTHVKIHNTTQHMHNLVNARQYIIILIKNTGDMTFGQFSQPLTDFASVTYDFSH